MERSDFGTNESGPSGVADDVSFDRGSNVGNTGIGSAGGSTASTASADASGSTGSAGGDTLSEGRLATAKNKIGAAKEKVVDRMHATADWIKERDIDQFKGTIEQQVRDHPGRTLLIAVGLGYLIARAFRGNNSV